MYEMTFVFRIHFWLSKLIEIASIYGYIPIQINSDQYKIHKKQLNFKNLAQNIDNFCHKTDLEMSPRPLGTTIFEEIYTRVMGK